MSEPKSFASLSSGLLARKGNARPAMRPQSFGNMGSGIEDLGWNDMGYGDTEADEQPTRIPSPITALTPMTCGFDDEHEAQPLVVEQQRAAIAASFGAEPMNEAEFEEALLSGAAEEAGVLAVKARKPVTVREPEAPSAWVEPASAPVQVPERPAARASAGKSKAAFTLRLDPDRHFKLRLACAVSGRSAQQIVTEALDRLLDAKPEISSLADRVPMGEALRTERE